MEYVLESASDGIALRVSWIDASVSGLQDLAGVAA